LSTTNVHKREERGILGVFVVAAAEIGKKMRDDQPKGDFRETNVIAMIRLQMTTWNGRGVFGNLREMRKKGWHKRGKK
jgi:hypothetical protein